ncbi:type II toxin-antitoxin system HigB family toxin [Erwinia tasmaniensis]|uniref:type II toxin-antitoxin system HigB family toxin n=1 Tax=Erwinia tasmaniensis TaxID=338565 RepID=UPI0005B486AD|nr:type II toxin-antitoxin system HigB family toxin [Erwinia tasmaniensis]
MRVITAKAVTEAMQKHAQWRVGLKLWLSVFNTPTLRFNSFSQLQTHWLQVSGWDLDFIACARLKTESRKGPLDICVFDIHKNQCRLVTWINTRSGTLYIKQVCSHADYDKWWRDQTKAKR